VEKPVLTYGKKLINLAYNFYGGRGVLTRVLTLVSLRTPAHAMKPGDIKDDAAGHWLMACPKCGLVSYLAHTVMTTHDQISISPSIECPNPNCDFLEVITGWTLRRAYKKNVET
jgi:hypothetical protein